MYFTCEDNPHAGKRNLQHDVVKKFKDLGKVDFNIITFKEDFQFDKFYSVLFINIIRNLTCKLQLRNVSNVNVS